MIISGKRLYSGLLTLLLCVSLSSLYSKIVEEKHIASVSKYIDPNNKGLCVIFDLDNTTLRLIKDEGNTEWFNAATQYFINKGLSRGAAVQKVSPSITKFQKETPVEAVEPEVVKLIDSLQKKNIRVIALTARLLEQEEITLKQLESLKIDFSITNTSIPLKFAFDHLPRPARYDKGVIFCSGNPKDVVLLSFFEKAHFKPTCVVFVDDQKKYLEVVQKGLEDAGIKDFVGIRYSFLDERVKNFKLDEHFEDKLIPEQENISRAQPQFSKNLLDFFVRAYKSFVSQLQKIGKTIWNDSHSESRKINS